MADEPRKLRKQPEQVEAYLNDLDGQPISQRQLDARKSERYTYRIQAMQVEFTPQTGRPERHLVPTRNLSREGASFLVGHYVYPGTACSLKLISIHDNAYPVPGVVVHCRYLMGSGSVHEVGVKFQRPVDVALFHHEAKELQILLVDDDTTMPQLVRSLLKSCALDLTYADNGQTGVELVMQADYDLVMLDMDMPVKDGFQTALEMRERGYRGAIVAVTAMTRKEDRQRCFEAGCTHYVPKPLTRERLTNMLRAATKEPLVSTLDGEGELADLIDSFVRELPMRLDDLQHALARNDLDSFARTVRLMKGQAGSFGFEVITDLAEALEKLLIQNVGIDALQSQLVELAHWCKVARPSNDQPERG